MSKFISINIDDSFIFDLKLYEKFLKDIKSLYDSFKLKSEEFNEEWRQFKNNKEYKEQLKKFHISPEKERYLSPITIFDGEWGTGKTFFLENLMKKCIKNEIKLDSLSGFKSIILIDLWEYMNNQNMVNDIVYDVYNKLAPLKRKKINRLIKILSIGVKTTLNLSNIFVKNNISLDLSLTIDKKLSIKKWSINKIKNHLKNIDKTILIFDNIERIDDKAIEVIKLIQKISNVDKLLIILVMNLEKFKYWKKEDRINKYITLGKYFKFHQKDYKSILLSKGIKKEFIREINDFLESDNNKNKLSIRDLDKMLNPIKLNEYITKSKYAWIFYINNNIWKNDEEVKRIIKTDIESMFSYLNKRIDSFKKQFFSKISNNFLPVKITNGMFSEYINGDSNFYEKFWENIPNKSIELIQNIFYRVNFFTWRIFFENEIEKIIKIVNSKILNSKKDIIYEKWKTIMNHLNNINKEKNNIIKNMNINHKIIFNNILKIYDNSTDLFDPNLINFLFNHFNEEVYE